MATAIANLDNEGVQVNTEKDNVIIQKVERTIRGGRTLDMTGWPFDVVSAGVAVIEETATKICKPMPLASGNAAYASLPAGHTVKGIVIASKLKTKPFVGVMYSGVVNSVAAPFPYTLAITIALSPFVTFIAD